VRILRVVYLTLLAFLIIGCEDNSLPIVKKQLIQNINVSVVSSLSAIISGDSVSFVANLSESNIKIFWKVNGIGEEQETGWVSGDLDTTLALTTVGTNTIQVKVTSDSAIGFDTCYVTVAPKEGSITQLRYVGSRSSYYGFDPFPSPESISSVYQKMSAKIEGSTPSAVWIVGGIRGSSCSLEFPNGTGKTYPNIQFDDSYDKHEPYLTEFDRIGVKVFLQVEAGMADMKTLMKLVLDRYGKHTCVAGFGADIEWYPSTGETNGDPAGINRKLTNEELAEWDALVKSYNPNYRVFVKHWIPTYCGTSAVSDVIYINDTQGYKSSNELTKEFADWARYYSPNDVGFQIGYDNDSAWWNLMTDPLAEITAEIDATIPDQTCHIYWVDFSLQEPKMAEYWK